MSKKAKTIQIFLPSGDPSGIREASFTTGILRVIEVPKTPTHLAEFYGMPESKAPCVYFLLEEDNDSAKPQVYIGQTYSVQTRFASHHEKKLFWQKAMVVSSRAEGFSTAHLLHLERMCIERAKAAGRFEVNNDNGGQRAPLPKQMMADCEDFFDSANLLLTTLGLDLFTTGTSLAEPTYRCTAVGTDARAQYSPEGMTVLAGSKARVESTPSFETKSFYQLRKKLLETGILKPDGGALVFTEDFIFNSPSAAAAVIVGNNTNGWEAWRTDDGKTLDEVIRKAVTPVGALN